MRANSIRDVTLRNMPAVIFLLAYFLTGVVGNLIYASPFGAAYLKMTGRGIETLSFPESFTFGYFVLLLLPFVVTPPIVWLTRRSLAPLQPEMNRLIPEIGRPEYAMAVIALVVYLVFVFTQANVVSLFLQGDDMTSSIAARFEILQRVGGHARAALHSVLWFLSIYAYIRALRTKELFWIICFVLTFLIVSVLLTMLNMKWPVLLYFVAIILGAFAFTQRPYISTIMGSILLLCAYVVISLFVFRAVSMMSLEDFVGDHHSKQSPVLSQNSVGEQASLRENGIIAGTEPEIARAARQKVIQSSRAFYGSPLVLATNPLNRMALPILYYYHVFTEEGPICGYIWARHPPCLPTYVIYKRENPTDRRFAGRGTAPAAVHISAYARGGWPTAILALAFASAVLGAYASLPLGGSSTIGAMFIAGSIAGYHFSQLPVEGPIIYDHGLLYSTVAVVLLLAATQVRRRFAAKPATIDQWGGQGSAAPRL